MKKGLEVFCFFAGNVQLLQPQAGRSCVHPRTKVKCWLPQTSRDLPNIRRTLDAYRCCLFFFSLLFFPFFQSIPFWTFFSLLGTSFLLLDVKQCSWVVVWFCMHAKWLFILYRAHRTVLSNSVWDDICFWCVVKVLPFSDHTENRAALQVGFTLRDAFW